MRTPIVALMLVFLASCASSTAAQPPKKPAREQAFVVVLDTSGSMDAKRLTLAKEVAKRFRDALPDDAWISLVAFHARPTVVVLPTRVSDRATFDAAIGRLRAGGGTEIYNGIVAGWNTLSKRPGAHRVMVLLTDGQSRRDGILEQVDAIRATGAHVSAVAMGQGADTKLLQQVAERGQGRYYFVERFEDLPNTLKREARAAQLSL